MNHLNEVIQIANTYPDGQVLFKEPLQIKSSPHQHLFTAYGVWAGPTGIYLLDGSGTWYGPLLESQANAGLMLSSLYQRLKVLQTPPSIVVAIMIKD